MYNLILDEHHPPSQGKVYRFIERSLLSTRCKKVLIYTHAIVYLLLLYLLLKIELLLLLFPTIYVNILFLSLLDTLTNNNRNGKITLINLKRRTIEFYRYQYPQSFDYAKLKVFIKHKHLKIVAQQNFFVSSYYYGSLNKIFPSSDSFLEQLEKNGATIINASLVRFSFLQSFYNQPNTQNYFLKNQRKTQHSKRSGDDIYLRK